MRAPANGQRPVTRSSGRRGLVEEPLDRDRLVVSVWLRLLKVHALVERDVRRALPGHLTLPRFDVLNQLARVPDGMSFVQLSRRLLVTAGNLTGIVDRLARDGLVRRMRHPLDGRAFQVRLTGRGEQAVRRSIGVHNRALRRLMHGLTHRELTELRLLLGRLRDDVEQRTGERPGGRDRKRPRGTAPVIAHTRVGDADDVTVFPAARSKRRRAG